jgi:hypothetical protein
MDRSIEKIQGWNLSTNGHPAAGFFTKEDFEDNLAWQSKERAVEVAVSRANLVLRKWGEGEPQTLESNPRRYSFLEANNDILGQQKADPWKNRSAGMKCNTCMWYAEKKLPTNHSPLGRCRRHAPTMSGYPVVYPTDWCGDHKLDEAKVEEI